MVPITLAGGLVSRSDTGLAGRVPSHGALARSPGIRAQVLVEEPRAPGVQVGARDRAIVRDLVRFGALTVDQIGRRHFGSKNTAYKRLERLADGGYVELVRWWLRGPGVYRPTRAGARMAGLGLEPERLKIGALPHDLAVIELADWLLGRNRGFQWQTERELRRAALRGVRQQRGGRLAAGSGHIPDGALVRGAPDSVAVELELSGKATSTYERILLSYAGELGFQQVWWFVEPLAVRERLARLVERLGVGDLVSVYPAPAGVRVLPWP